jgi:hypothetical protein
MQAAGKVACREDARGWWSSERSGVKLYRTLVDEVSGGGGGGGGDMMSHLDILMGQRRPAFFLSFEEASGLLGQWGK